MFAAISCSLGESQNVCRGPSSCKGKCQLENEEDQGLGGLHDNQKVYPTCFCDKSCLFLGDCCFDFLFECDSRFKSLEDGITQQMVHFRRFQRYTMPWSVSVIDLNKRQLFEQLLIPVIRKCPENASKDYIELCENLQGRYDIAEAPVVFQGAVFYNDFCAACHGIPQEEIENFQIVVDGGSTYKKVFLSAANSPVRISRFYGNIRQNFCTTNPMATICGGGPYKDECDSYMAPLTATFLTGPGPSSPPADMIYKNEACLKCLNASIEDVCYVQTMKSCDRMPYSITTWASFFDFTGKSKRCVFPSKPYLYQGAHFTNML